MFLGLAEGVTCDPLGGRRGVESLSCVIHVASDQLLGVYLEDHLRTPKTVGLDCRPPGEDLQGLTILGMESISQGQCFSMGVLRSTVPMSYVVYCGQKWFKNLPKYVTVQLDII